MLYLNSILKTDFTSPSQNAWFLRNGRTRGSNDVIVFRKSHPKGARIGIVLTMLESFRRSFGYAETFPLRSTTPLFARSVRLSA